VSIWDFSGVESYYVTYDKFLGDPNAIYLVVVSCEDSMSERRRQIDFWLNFIATRMIPVEPIGECCTRFSFIRFIHSFIHSFMFEHVGIYSILQE